MDNVFKKTAMCSFDIDPKVAQFLDALRAAGKIDGACAYLEANLQYVARDKVENWPAYIFTLLRKYDVDFYQAMKAQRGKPRTRAGRQNLEKGGPGKVTEFEFNTNVSEFIPGQAWTRCPAAPKSPALTPKGVALNLTDGAALDFPCGKDLSPSHAAAQRAKDDHRMINAAKIAHEACEIDTQGLEHPTFDRDSRLASAASTRECSIDSVGTKVPALTPKGLALDLTDGAALEFPCGKDLSPSHAAAQRAKEEHRMINAVKIAHEVCEMESQGLEHPTFGRECSIDSDGVMHGPLTPDNKTSGVARMKLFHKKRIARTESDISRQSTVASVDGSGSVQDWNMRDVSDLIVPAVAEAI